MISKERTVHPKKRQLTIGQGYEIFGLSHGAAVKLSLYIISSLWQAFGSHDIGAKALAFGRFGFKT